MNIAKKIASKDKKGKIKWVVYIGDGDSVSMSSRYNDGLFFPVRFVDGIVDTLNEKHKKSDTVFWSVFVEDLFLIKNNEGQVLISQDCQFAMSDDRLNMLVFFERDKEELTKLLDFEMMGFMFEPLGDVLKSHLERDKVIQNKRVC